MGNEKDEGLDPITADRATIMLHDDLTRDDDSMTTDEIFIDDSDALVGQLKQKCRCTDEQKARRGVAEDGKADVCLPCEIRGAVNAVHAAAEKLSLL